MRREDLYNVSKSRKNSVGTKGIYVSVVILILILASLSGATYAWFAHQASAGDTTFVAGTVKLTAPINVEDILIHPGSSVKHAFIPNSGEASVSKVDLVDHEEIARYYTAPRVDDRIADDDNPGEWVYNEVEPYDWRTSRIAQDASNNVWVLNVGAEQNDLQGSVVRIQANTAGLNNTHSYPNEILPFGTDDAVQVFPVGTKGDMPRAIAIDSDGFIWVGFYSGGYLQKYEYNPSGPSLDPVQGATFRYGDDPSNNIKFYEMKFDPDGILWISSRSSSQDRPGVQGVFSFNANNSTKFVRHAEFNPYSILISEGNRKVYVSNYDSKYIWEYDLDNTNRRTIQITDASNLRGMALDNNGKIWIASTTHINNVFDGKKVFWFNPVDDSQGSYTLQVGNTPVGVGMDPFGNMWAVCRTDNLGQGVIEAFNPETSRYVAHIQVGRRPYAYGDFTLVDDSCKTVKWSFENEGTKRVYVRVKPTATLNSNSNDVRITLCDGQANWRLGSDGWYYFGGEAGPTMVPAPDTGNTDANVVNVCFKYCFAADTGYDLIVKLEAQAVQSSNNAIDHEWVSHPWFNVTQ